MYRHRYPINKMLQLQNPSHLKQQGYTYNDQSWNTVSVGLFSFGHGHASFPLDYTVYFSEIHILGKEFKILLQFVHNWAQYGLFLDKSKEKWDTTSRYNDDS